MIHNYNDFILDKQFNSIINSEIFLVESRKNWDYTEEEQSPIEFSFNLHNKSNKNKLEKFLEKLPKEKIKYYFYKLLQKIKNMPKSVRKRIFITYSFIFLSFISVDYLLDSPKNNDLVSEFKEEIVEVKSIIEDSNNKELKKLSSFDKAQSIVKKVEGGYSQDRKDRGNFVNTPYGKRFLGTNHGISAPLLADYMKKLPTKDDMKNLSYETALDIYKQYYWEPQNLSHFKDQNISNILYDATVNQGINGTKKILRKAYNNVGLKISNNENPFSLTYIEKANNLDQEKLFNQIKLEREKRYKSSKTYKVHGKGWLSRLNNFTYKNENINSIRPHR